MKFRQHRGGLAASFDTQVELLDHQALIAYCRNLLYPYGFDFSDSDLDYVPYGSDERIYWGQVWLVTIKGYGVMGMADAHPLWPKDPANGYYLCAPDKPRPQDAPGRWAHTRIQVVGQESDFQLGLEYEHCRCQDCGTQWTSEIAQ